MFTQLHQLPQLPAALGPQLTTASLSIVPATGATFATSIAGDQNSGVAGAATLRVVDASRSKVNLASLDISSSNITTAAYVQVLAVTSAAINRLYIAVTTGSFLILAVGAAASEVDQIYLGPGFSGWVDLFIPNASRLSVKALDVNATAGFLALTGFS